MRTAARMMLVAAPLALAACDSSDEVEMPMATEDMPMASQDMPMNPDEMPMMDGVAEMQMASTEGTVTAIDQTAGTITIDHAPVPSVNWPAMTMAFDADETMLQQVEVGDKVSFAFRMSDVGNEITSIVPQ